MRKLYFLFPAIALASTLNAQINFSDDFESYAAGALLGASSPNWNTWSMNDTPAEDSPVGVANAHAGLNSVYFSSTAANGGPQDCLLPFGGAYNTGQFEFESWFFVNTGTGAYFNFQAATTPGTAWALDVYMNGDGSMSVVNDGALVLTGLYPQNAWFKLTMPIDLNTNTWNILIDNVSQGIFQTNLNQIASIDFYPVSGQQFYIDDVKYSYSPYTLLPVNLAATAISGLSSGLAGQAFEASVTVRNLGLQPITSFDVSLTYNGITQSKTITGVNIASLASSVIVLDNDYVLGGGSNPATATISNVNGSSADSNPDDDIKTITISPVTPAINKVVVAEEATGTWCGWCPRGAVFMDLFSEKYDQFFVGIAVHNADPMTVPIYDSGFGANGFPNAAIDRGTQVDPSAMEPDFLARIVTPASGVMAHSGSYIAGNPSLSFVVSTTFTDAVTGAWKLAVVLTEDEVTGTGSGYNQTNYYAGGGNGVMGGFEALPSSVPASQMTYNHVARSITPSYGGQVFAGSISPGEAVNDTFELSIDPSWDLDQIKVISLLIDPTGRIDNAFKTNLQVEVGINEKTVVNDFRIFPNPAANGFSQLMIELKNSQDGSVEIFDMTGKLIETKSFSSLTGGIQMPINTAALTSGIYLVKLSVGNEIHTRRLVVTSFK